MSFRKYCSFLSPLVFFLSTCKCNCCGTRSYLCYPASCQGSSTGELKVNVKGQCTLKYFEHSAPKHLKGKVCHCRVHWERRVLPYSQGNYPAGTNSPKPWGSLRYSIWCQMLMLQQYHRNSSGKINAITSLTEIKELIPLNFIAYNSPAKTLFTCQVNMKQEKISGTGSQAWKPHR